MDSHKPPLFTLPAELIHHVLSFLSPLDLAEVSQTCHLLHNHTLSDQLWQPFVQANVPGTILKSPYPATSWRSLYIDHHPYWFLSKHKIWFADNQHTGKLLIARYDPRLPAIEAYALVAERRQPTTPHWHWNPNAIIHTFSPRIQLDLNAPVLRLDTAALAQARRTSLDTGSRLQREIPMAVHGITTTTSAGLFSRLLLSRPLPPAAITPGTRVWPPATIPAPERTRRESVSRYRSSGHRPGRLRELSSTTFRLRKWVQFSGRAPQQGLGTRVGEDVATFATLDPALYTPTAARPWRGIWCGDYSGHGCEFLVVMQPEEPGPLPEAAERALARRSASVGSEESEGSAAMGADDGGGEGADVEAGLGALRIGVEDPEERKYRGRIEAVKLTGDPNIPRGEYTFIAPDISRDGLLRVAQEEIFKGARVVRCVGHIAAAGFREDDFIPSQLILISHDKLAQYWETFGHVSFYQRVDIDQFTRIP
ncbi:uncharacterized protein K441DRAFT_644240 [Cenococcum geophilum 1.58]|uniref:uncharacterized protein n=1 Tax=Cenococcum geophilum 1.58 TaxID=794803 RepID=UPI00358E4B97|nr:hypothetical protein K441DRAFT_644240 [Cenococcum geophilum 1.58]